MEKFWPGPLTIVFPKKDIIPKETSGGLDTVALRCPQNAATRALIKAAGVPLAGPSANISGRPSPTTTDDVLHDMNGRISAVVDDGPCNIGLESTIIGVENGEIVVYRPGGITLEMLQEIGPARMDSNLIVDTGHPKAPGMKYRHYAPKAPLTVYTGDRDSAAAKILEKVHEGDVSKIGFLSVKKRLRCFLKMRSAISGAKERIRKASHITYSQGCYISMSSLLSRYTVKEQIRQV